MSDSDFKSWCAELQRQLADGVLVQTGEVGTIRRPRFIRGRSHAHSRKIYREHRARLTYRFIWFFEPLEAPTTTTDSDVQQSTHGQHGKDRATRNDD